MPPVEKRVSQPNTVKVVSIEPGWVAAATTKQANETGAMARHLIRMLAGHARNSTQTMILRERVQPESRDKRRAINSAGHS